MVAVYGGGLRTLFMVYGVRVLKKRTWFKGCVAENGCRVVRARGDKKTQEI